MLCLVALSCPTLCDPMYCSPPGSSVHGDSPGKNTEVGCHALLQGIFPTQESNQGLLHCRWILYQLSYQGSPENVWKFLKKLKIELPYDLSILLLGLNPQKTIIGKDTCTLMFTAALFKIAKTWKQPKCPSMDEWIEKM